MTSNNTDLDEILQPFSIHRSKYKTGIGTVARKQLNAKLQHHIKIAEIKARKDELLKTCKEWEKSPALPATYYMDRIDELNNLEQGDGNG